MKPLKGFKEIKTKRFCALVLTYFASRTWPAHTEAAHRLCQCFMMMIEVLHPHRQPRGRC